MPDHVVAFPEKILKTIVTRYVIFSLKFTKNRLSAPPDPLAAIWGLLLRQGNRDGERARGGGEVRGEGRGRRKGEGREEKGFVVAPSTHSCRRPWP